MSTGYLSGQSTPTGPAGGQLTGTYPNPTLNAPIANPGEANAAVLSRWVGAVNGAAPVAGTWLAGDWVVDVSTSVPTIWICTVGGTPGTWVAIYADPGPPSGPAGGDLTGTYPNPTLGVSGVTAGTYGDGTHVAQVTLDAKGRATAAAAVTITGAAPTGAAGGDLGGNYPNPDVEAIDGVVLSGVAPSNGQVLTATGAAAAGWAAPAPVAPTGAAGGDLGSTYPNPTVTATHLAAALPLAQGGTANTTGQPSGTAGGDLGSSYPSPTVVATHLASPLPVAQGGTGNASGAIFGIIRTPWSNTAVTSTAVRSANYTHYQRVIDATAGGTISKARIDVTVQAGNIALAVYPNSGAGLSAVPGARAGTSGSVACPAAGAADVSLGGSISITTADWLAIAADGVVAHFAGSPGLGGSTTAQGQSMSEATFPPPGTATPVADSLALFALWGVP